MSVFSLACSYSVPTICVLLCIDQKLQANLHTQSNMKNAFICNVSVLNLHQTKDPHNFLKHRLIYGKLIITILLRSISLM